MFKEELVLKVFYCLVYVIAFSISLSTSTLADQEKGVLSQEGRGGNILIPGFKRIGHYLSYHVSNKQNELGHLMRKPKSFDKSISEIPVRIVDDFPEAIVKKYGNHLVGVTISDRENSPTGYTILLHAKRYPQAFNRFAAGKNSEKIKIISKSIKVTKPQEEGGSRVETTETTRVEDLNDGFEIFEGSFLVFVLHELLLASGEADDNFEISPFLRADRSDFMHWVKNQPKEKLTNLKVWFPATIGKIFNNPRSKRDALDSLISLWKPEGERKEQEFESMIDNAFKEKGIEPVTRKWVQDQNENNIADCNYYYMGNRKGQTNPGLAGIYCQRQKKLNITLRTFKKNIKVIPLDAYVIGNSYFYDEIGSGTINWSALHQAFVDARRRFISIYEEKMSEVEEKAKVMYGDRLLFLGPGPIWIDNDCDRYRSGFTMLYTYDDPRYSYPKKKVGMGNCKAWASMSPTAYVIE